VKGCDRHLVGWMRSTFLSVGKLQNGLTEHGMHVARTLRLQGMKCYRGHYKYWVGYSSEKNMRNMSSDMYPNVTAA